MKKLALLLALISFSVAAYATEPLLLDPLPASEYANVPVVSTPTNNASGLQISVPGQAGMEATFTPVSKLDSNMIPQNAAAEGLPVPAKQTPRVRIQTKQRSQGNAYWNAGGKGTKSFF